MIVDKINSYLSQSSRTVNDVLRHEVEQLAGFAFERQFMTERGDYDGSLRLSSAGKCARQLAYKYHGFPEAGKEIDSRASLVFWTGDLVEMTIVTLAKAAGVAVVATGFSQLEVSIPVNGLHVNGHPDGLVIDNGETLLLEVKSMSSYSFDDFVKGMIDESYRTQINCYMFALKLKRCVLVGYNKDSGVLHEMTIEFDPKIVKAAQENLIKVIHSTKENLPERRYEPNEKGFYPWQCRYCAFYKTCLPNAELVLVGKSYKLKEKKQCNAISAEKKQTPQKI